MSGAVSFLQTCPSVVTFELKPSPFIVIQSSFQRHLLMQYMDILPLFFDSTYNVSDDASMYLSVFVTYAKAIAVHVPVLFVLQYSQDAASS
jgi:hypothetical protein